MKYAKHDFSFGNDKGDFNFIRKKRAVSVMSSYNSTPVAKNVSSPATIMQAVESMYSCLDFDKAYLQRCIESENYVQR